MLRVLAFTAVAFAACTGTAMAGTVSFDGTAVVFTGTDTLAHEVQFRLATDASGDDEVLDTQPITIDPSAVGCSFVTAAWVKCPGHTSARIDLGSGNDDVDFRTDCFEESYVVNLGEGNNRTTGSECPTAGPATITGGGAQDDIASSSGNDDLHGGGGDDTIHGGDGNDVLRGGDGTDRLFGDSGNDQIFGEAGDDDPHGGPGDDLLDGGPGNDRLGFSIGLSGNDVGAGADTYVGGAGTDELWFDAHAGDMAISINGAADDGNPGEHDNVGADIETVNGSGGNDVFTGSAAADGFSGGSGNDEMHGADGPDRLYGGGGDDRIYGDAGADKVEGANGSDVVDGGSGIDQIYGDIGSCSVFCTLDADKLFARDGEQDVVDCGGGADTAQVDQLDVVAFCSVIDRQALGAAAPGSPGPGAAGLTLTTGARPSVAQGVRVTVACPAACTFTVSLVISARTARRYGLGKRALTIGAARGSLLNAGRKTVKIRLSARARSRLKRVRKLAATLKVSAKDAGGTTTTTTRAVTLRR